jgi:serine/threonine protein kinase
VHVLSVRLLGRTSLPNGAGVRGRRRRRRRLLQLLTQPSLRLSKQRAMRAERLVLLEWNQLRRQLESKAMPEGVPFGPYLIIKRLAVGGMAEVFLARTKDQRGPGRLLVLKRMLPMLSADPTIATMFLDEARIASQLAHPYLIQIYDVGHVEHALYIAMEYVHGVNTGELAQASRARGIEVPWPLAARLACYLCEALQYAHDVRGIDGRPLQLVHRDITPTNIMLTYSGTPKLVDFGIARAARRLSVTQPGMVKGKLLYAAPEQYLDKPVDSRTDLYGLGLCLYELLGGRQPFGDLTTPLEVAEAVTTRKPAPLLGLRRDVPKKLAELVHQALEKDPAHRPASALELRTHLEGVLMEERVMVGMPEIERWVGTIFPGRATLRPNRSDGEEDQDAETQRASAVVARPPTHATQPLDDAQRDALLHALEVSAASASASASATETDPEMMRANIPVHPSELRHLSLPDLPARRFEWRRWIAWILAGALMFAAAAWGAFHLASTSRPP